MQGRGGEATTRAVRVTEGREEGKGMQGTLAG